MRRRKKINPREEACKRPIRKMLGVVIITLLSMLLIPGITYSQILSGLTGTIQEIDIADGFTGVGARAMGMGGSQIAIAGDYSAVYWNPAQLAYMKRIEISGGLTFNRIENNTTYEGYSTEESSNRARLNSLGFVIPVPTTRGGLAFGLGYNRLQNFDRIFKFRYPVEGDVGLERKSGGLYAISLASGIQIAPIMSVGLNFELWGGENNYSWDYENYYPDDEIISREIFEDNFKYKYSGFSARMGMTLTPHKIIRLGAVITFPAGFTIDEEGTMKTDTLFRSGDEAYYEDYGYVEAYKISLPFRFSLGTAILLPYFTTSFDVTYIDWAQMEYKEPSWALSNNKYIPQNYRSVLKYNIGVEAVIPYTMVKLRGGYRNDPVPYTGNTIVKDRQYFTGGIGVLISDLVSLDAAAVFGNYEIDHKSAELSESYKLTDIFLNMAYRF
ncbi:hypothetical protein JXI42_13460 [bacterium]|nr:hypothetical protein [bacterium]